MKEGLFTIYAGFNPANFDKVNELIYKEVDKIKSKKVTKKEIDSAKKQLEGNFLLGLENTTSIMSYCGKSEVLWDDIETIDYVLKKIDDINEESIEIVIDKIFNSEKSAVAIVGR
jgi:predicted Zn-dependent peptidase